MPRCKASDSFSICAAMLSIADSASRFSTVLARNSSSACRYRESACIADSRAARCCSAAPAASAWAEEFRSLVSSNHCSY
ncbi:hypothetical protein D9M69_673620 [compost metagenome]